MKQQFGFVAWYRFTKNTKRLPLETANFKEQHKKLKEAKGMEIDLPKLLEELRIYAKGTSCPCHCFPISEGICLVMESNRA